MKNAADPFPARYINGHGAHTSGYSSSTHTIRIRRCRWLEQFAAADWLVHFPSSITSIYLTLYLPLCVLSVRGIFFLSGFLYPTRGRVCPSLVSAFVLWSTEQRERYPSFFSCCCCSTELQPARDLVCWPPNERHHIPRNEGDRRREKVRWAGGNTKTGE